MKSRFSLNDLAEIRDRINMPKFSYDFDYTAPWNRRSRFEMPEISRNTYMTVGIGLGIAAMLGVAAGAALRQRDRRHRLPKPAVHTGKFEQ